MTLLMLLCKFTFFLYLLVPLIRSCYHQQKSFTFPGQNWQFWSSWSPCTPFLLRLNASIAWRLTASLSSPGVFSFTFGDDKRSEHYLHCSQLTNRFRANPSFFSSILFPEEKISCFKIWTNSNVLQFFNHSHTHEKEKRISPWCRSSSSRFIFIELLD